MINVKWTRHARTLSISRHPHHVRTAQKANVAGWYLRVIARASPQPVLGCDGEGGTPGPRKACSIRYRWLKSGRTPKWRPHTGGQRHAPGGRHTVWNGAKRSGGMHGPALSLFGGWISGKLCRRQPRQKVVLRVARTVFQSQRP